MKALLLVIGTWFAFSLQLQAQYFTKVTTGPVVKVAADSRSVNWVDFNNDGFVDLMITNGPSGGQNNCVFVNDQKGGFVQLLTDTIVKDKKPSDGASWADVDNDGQLDCFVANWYNVNNLLYFNAQGKFELMKSGSVVTDAGYSETGSFADYDQDGFVDLYVTNSAGNKRNFLYHNNGDRTFTKITTGAMVTDAFDSRCVNWTDIDLDGDVDLFVTNESNQNEQLYRNDGNGIFTKLTTGPLVNNGGNTMSGSWGDYDNDGDLDVYLCNDGGSNALFQNKGNFEFALVDDVVSKTDHHSFSSAWSDIDNDGDLDLFVTNAFFTTNKQVNLFYLNNGNGTFERQTSDVIARDSAWSYGCAFGDYDNDGFEDLAVATTRFGGVDEPDFLYHNAGNGNNWITIKLLGTKSNHVAIGAKVRIKATIDGKSVWQLREVSAQNAYCSQNDLRVHFGLKEAKLIDSLRIEWPSGLKEYYVAVAVDRVLTLREGEGTISAIQPILTPDAIRIYPNPARSILLLEKAQGLFGSTDRISLHDQVGNLVQTWPAEAAAVLQLNIDASKANAGAYLLRVNSADHTYWHKVVLSPQQ